MALGHFLDTFLHLALVQCIIDLVIVYLLSLVGVNKTVEIGAA